MCFCSNDLCNGKNKLDTKECSITESLESSPVRLHREQLAHELHPKCYCQCYDQNYKHNMHLIEYILIDIFFLFLHSIFRVHKFKWVYNEWKKKIRRKMLFFFILTTKAVLAFVHAYFEIRRIFCSTSSLFESTALAAVK